MGKNSRIFIEYLFFWNINFMFAAALLTVYPLTKQIPETEKWKYKRPEGVHIMTILAWLYKKL